MTKFKHIGLHAEELVGGVMIGPGEEVDLSGEQVKDNERLIDEGILMPLEEESGSKSGSKKKEETS